MPKLRYLRRRFRPAFALQNLYSSSCAKVAILTPPLSPSFHVLEAKWRGNEAMRHDKCFNGAASVKRWKWNSLEVTEIAIGQCKVEEGHDLTTFLAKLRSTVPLPGLQLLYKIVVEGSRAIMLWVKFIRLNPNNDYLSLCCHVTAIAANQPLPRSDWKQQYLPLPQESDLNPDSVDGVRNR